jgi:putative membrane protein
VLLMGVLTFIAVGVVVLLHVLFFVLESILWTKPFGRRTFGLSAELAESTKSLALNQGLYNLFLAAGLIWSFFVRDCGFEIRVFFLICVIVAGIVGGITAKRSILWIQALPGIVALLLVCFSQR